MDLVTIVSSSAEVFQSAWGFPLAAGVFAIIVLCAGLVAFTPAYRSM